MNPDTSHSTRSLAAVLAAVALATGLLGVAGQLPAFPELAAPVPGWPPLRIYGSLLLTAIALGVLATFLGQRRLGLTLSGGATLAGLTALLSRLGGVALPDGELAVAAGTMLTTAAAGVCAAGLSRRREQEALAFGVSGFVLVALSITFLLARATNVLDPLADPKVAGVSIQVVAGSLLLGASYLVAAWSPGLPESARWLPWAAGLAGAVTVLVLGQALTVRERAQLLALATQAAGAERRGLLREVEVTARTMLRVANARVNRLASTQRDGTIEDLRRDLSGLTAGYWLRLDGTAPEAITVAPPYPGVDSVWRAYLARTGGLPDSVAFLPLDDRSRVFLAVAPACRDGACAGAMGGVMHAASLFRDVLSDTTRGFRFSISGGGEVLGGGVTPSPGERRLSRSLPLEMGSVRFILTAWPTAATLASNRSSLPGLVMTLGFVVSALMTGIIALAQRARRSAREAERGRLALALERATDGIWEWDLVTGSAMRSRGMLRYLGYEAQALPDVPQTWMGLIHPEDRPAVEAALARHLAGEAPNFEAVYRVRSSTGRWHVIVDRGRVTDRDPDGRPLRVLGISADVTEAREAQAAQEATERRFRTLFDSGFQPKLLLDSKGLVIEVNRAALEAVAADDGAEIRGRPAWEVLWWGHDPAAVPRLKQAIAEAGSDGGVARYEETLQGPAGQVVILEIGVKPIEQGPGQPPQLLLEARDLTARRRAEAALQEVDTLTTMGRVAARVAHEINNPLAGIQNSFLLIKGAIPADHPHFRYVGAIEREIGRIAAVTRQLYETYRPETDRTGETSVRTVLGDAVAFMEQVNRSARVKVELRFEQLPTVVPLPSSMLRQIAYNLVQNAIEASPPDCTVTITAGVEEGDVVLRVRDCGPGIPEELRERIFEPFFSTKDKRIRTGGMGLGLALVRRTVTAAGGSIAVQDAEGGGSLFTVRLPLLHDQDRGVAS